MIYLFVLLSWFYSSIYLFFPVLPFTQFSRIVDEELQSIIDSQLKNFESFKIPKSEPEEEDELETLRKKALKVYESQMERTVDTVEARELPGETTTSSYGFADYIEDNTGRSLIETSTGDDVFVVDEFVD